MQQIKERGALPMIDRGDIRQAIDRCSNIWASLPGAGYGQFEHKADSLIAKFKEAGGTVREIDGEQSHRDYLRSGYLHHRLARHGLLIITVITPLPTKPGRDKNARTGSWRTRQHRRRCVISVMFSAPINIRELTLKPEMMPCDDVAAGRRLH